MNVIPQHAVATLDAYLESGGGQGVSNARRQGPDAVLDEIARAGLRGRGGAGFPAATKWRSVRDAPGTDKYVVANGAEGEPGTFKDRTVMRFCPYEVIEGAAIAALVVGAVGIYIVTKRSFTREVERLRAAVAELESAGLVGDVPIQIVEGPDEYLFGEETGALEVIEGNDPLPRVLRPYEQGLFATSPQLGWASHEQSPGHAGVHTANPTVVSNVETLAHATWIMAFGAEEFRRVGVPSSPGTMPFTVCGDIDCPGVYELPMGTPLRTLVDDFGAGVPGGRSVKMVLSGVANPVILPADLDVGMDFDSMAAIGSGLGSGGFVVYDDAMCAVAVARSYSRFLWIESCGQCPPCKLGSETITEILERIEAGHGDASDIGTLQRTLTTVTDANRCYLGAEEQRVVGSLLDTFAADFETHLVGSCALRHDVLVPKIVDFDETGRFVFDRRQLDKRPDWTYAS
jgi:NADH:ubiquinone oxidoreductase subunit F (NADH-binding)